MKTCPQCGELVGDNVKVCFNCNYDFQFKRVLDRHQVTLNRIDDEERINRKIEETKKLCAEKELQIKRNAMYEYTSVIINDKDTGEVDGQALQSALERYSEAGWRLHSIFSSEVGKSSTSVTVGFLGSAVNATIDQIVLIFERCIRAEDK